MDYKQAGVNINDGETFVKRIKPLAKKTQSKANLSSLGGFGGIFELDLSEYKKPLLVSSIDGVGTKLKIALLNQKYDTIGACLVNHCVNDILVCGAKPLFFLDYYACSKLSINNATDIVTGIVNACKENNVSLVGGETAEMPDVYSGDDFDLAGTIVGIVESDKVISGNKIRSGDVLIGLPSNGLHTNGYSLARKILSPYYKTRFKELQNRHVQDVLLDVHLSYLKTIRPMLSLFEIRGLSHITGGGIINNTMRILSHGLSLDIDWSAWETPFIFNLIQEKGSVSTEEMRKTFNMGIGLIIIASRQEADSITDYLRNQKERFCVIGKVRDKPNNLQYS